MTRIAAAIERYAAAGMSGAPASAAADTALVDYLRARRDELVEFARELVATPSPNPPGDERAVAALVIEQAARARRRATSRRPARPRSGRTSSRASARPAGASSSSAVTWTPSRRATSPSGAAIPTEPTIEDGELHGLGAGDMKGAVAAMVFARRRARGAAASSRARSGSCFTADEEAGSRFGAEWLAASGSARGRRGACSASRAASSGSGSRSTSSRAAPRSSRCACTARRCTRASPTGCRR